jgi:hypothetical protein
MSKAQQGKTIQIQLYEETRDWISEIFVKNY